MGEPDPAARAFSCLQRDDAYRYSQEGVAPASLAAGGGAATARMAAVTPSPADSPAATSSIETVQQSRRLAHPGELCICALGHSLQRTNPMPCGVRAERDQVAHHWMAIVQAGDNAH